MSGETTTVQKRFVDQYHDSVSLMQLSATLEKVPGVDEASAIMATEANLKLMAEAGLLSGIEAAPNELLVVIRGDADAVSEAMDIAEASLNRTGNDEASDDVELTPPRGIEMALDQMAEANLALISTPGEYAAAETLKALRLGLNAMVFSDNVELADELMLKRFARDHDLLVMGPDCGTAIVNGVPLGFANVVRRGPIGVVAASGTGLQQVTCLIDRLGQGITQAIGTGGHDLDEHIGGITMLNGLRALEADDETKVIVLISKPPAPEIADHVVDVAARADKPTVVNFIGDRPMANDIVEGRQHIRWARTLEDAATTAVALASGTKPDQELAGEGVPAEAVKGARRLTTRQRYLRGLYSGGTFCFEALQILGTKLGTVYSNTPLREHCRLANPWQSREHTLIDLGDDEFTRGRPHPIIDHRLRNERLLEESADPDVGVILFDVVLGYGAHDDPVEEMVPVLWKAMANADKVGRNIIFVASVCGTENDPQDLARQETALRQAKVLLADSNAQAVRLAASVIERATVG